MRSEPKFIMTNYFHINLTKFLSGLLNYYHQSLIYNASYLLGVNLIPAIMGFVTWGLASQFYSPTDVGLSSAILSGVVLIAVISGLGINTGIIRFLPISKFPNRVIETSYTFTLLISIIFSLVFLAGLRFWSPELEILNRDLFYFFAFTIFVASTALGTLVRDTFIACRQSQYAFAYTLISTGTRLILVMLMVNFGAKGFVGASSLAFAFALIICLMMYLPRIIHGYRIGFGIDISIMETLIPYSLGNYIAGLIGQLTQTVLPLMTLNILGADANGYAYISMLVGTTLASPGLALANSAFAEGANNLDSSAIILKKAALIGVSLTMLISTFVIMGAHQVLLIFGSDYSREGASLLRWIAFSSTFMVLNQLYFTHLRLRNRIGYLILLSCMLVTTSILVSYFLMGHLGISSNGIGILAGNSFTSLLIFVDLAHHFRKRFKDEAATRIESN